MNSRVKAYLVRLATANALALSAGILVIWIHGTAIAEEDDDGQRERALDLFEEAETLYDEGRLDEAVERLVEARSLYPEPVLLYNLARAYEGLGQLEDALDAYTRFLEETPDASDRGAIERRIESIRAQLAERERLATELQRREVEEEVDEPVAARPPRIVWPWVVMALGLATAGAGGAFGVLALTEREDAVDAQVHLDAVHAFERAETYAIVFDVVVAAGAILAAAGLAWALVARHRARAALASDSVTEVEPNE